LTRKPIQFLNMTFAARPAAMSDRREARQLGGKRRRARDDGAFPESGELGFGRRIEIAGGHSRIIITRSPARNRARSRMYSRRSVNASHSGWPWNKMNGQPMVFREMRFSVTALASKKAAFTPKARHSFSMRRALRSRAARRAARTGRFGHANFNSDIRNRIILAGQGDP
jgi:hypothetical protein